MKNFIFFLIIGFVFLPGAVSAFTAAEITNHQAPARYVYPQEFDVLVLDATIPSGKSNEPDVLNAITVQNDGTAHNVTEFSRVVLWGDAAAAGFQGMGIDTNLGEFGFNADSNGWYLNGLNVAVPANGLRIFVTVETGRTPTSERTIKMKIPVLQDKNQNDVYDPADLGVFLESKNNGPSDNFAVNAERQTIRNFASVEVLAPKAVITNLSDAATLTTTTYKILGMARDQGGSSVQWLKLGINNDWYDVKATGDNYYTWEYDWRDISEAVYAIKTKANDWLENITVSEPITITVEKEKAPEQTVEEETPPVEETPSVEEETPSAEVQQPETQTPAPQPITVAELQAKIKEIQLKIIELLSQLIKLLLVQLDQ